MENKKFGHFMKIMRSLKKVHDEEVLQASESLTFIKIEAVSKNNLPILVKDLEKLSTKLDEAVGVMFRKGSGPDLKEEYEDLLRQIKGKQVHLNYLSSYLETTKEKIESAKKALENYEKKVEDAEDKKRKIVKSMKRVRESWQNRKKEGDRDEVFRNRIKPPTPWTIVRNSAFKGKKQGDGHVELRLEPIRSGTVDEISTDVTSSQYSSIKLDGEDESEQDEDEIFDDDWDD